MCIRDSRYDIRFDLNDYYGGLHCGDCFEVFVRGKWKPTRMEDVYKRQMCHIAILIFMKRDSMM